MSQAVAPAVIPARNPRPRRATTGAYLYLLVIATGLFLFTGSYDPDFESYRLIYDVGGYWLADRGRDPLFVEFINAVGETVSYNAFRDVVALFFGFSLFVIAHRLRVFTEGGFGFVQALFLTPFILLKFHVQVREGAALLLWLYAITSFGGDLPRNVRSIRFWILGAVSSAIHASAMIWWIVGALLGLRNRPIATEMKRLTFLLFFIFGVATTTWGRGLFEGTEFWDVLFFSGFDDPVSADLWKLPYWLSFVVLPLFALWWFGKSAYCLTDPYSKVQTPSIFGLLGTYGLLGFFSAALLGIYFLGAAEGDFVKSMRIANTLMIFLAIHLGFVRPRSPVPWALLLFCMSDAIRVVLAGLQQ